MLMMIDNVLVIQDMGAESEDCLLTSKGLVECSSPENPFLDAAVTQQPLPITCPPGQTLVDIKGLYQSIDLSAILALN